VSLLQNSWTKGTFDQYQTYLNKWANYCKINKIETLNASIGQGVEFLSQLFHSSENAYSSMNTARSALSTVIPIKDGLTFGNQPIVKRLMKGKPALPKYSATFDVDIVFNYILTLPNAR